jgi:hypothetical protein
LIATVENRSRGGGTPTGEVVFLEGTTILGTETLTRGKASLTTTTLLLSRDKIHAEYVGTQTFAHSTATVVENVRSPRPKARITSRFEIPQAARGTSSARPAANLRSEGDSAALAETATFLAAPAVLGTIAFVGDFSLNTTAGTPSPHPSPRRGEGKPR